MSTIYDYQALQDVDAGELYYNYGSSYYFSDS